MEKPEVDQVDVVCVNWGTKYPVEYVERLHQMILNNTTRSFKMYCLTDNPEVYAHPIIPIRLKPGFNGWWNKMQLFRDDVLPLGEYLYFDLDVIIVSNIDCFFDFRGFGITRDFANPDRGVLGGKEYNSSIIRFTQDNNLWCFFQDNSEHWARWQKEIIWFGDQNVISQFLNQASYDKPFPDEWAWSFKIGSVRGRRPLNYSIHFGADIPEGGKVCIFHGRPNPDEVNIKWIKDAWGKNI